MDFTGEPGPLLLLLLLLGAQGSLLCITHPGLVRSVHVVSTN